MTSTRDTRVGSSTNCSAVCGSLRTVREERDGDNERCRQGGKHVPVVVHPVVHRACRHGREGGEREGEGGGGERGETERERERVREREREREEGEKRE